MLKCGRSTHEEQRDSSGLVETMMASEVDPPLLAGDPDPDHGMATEPSNRASPSTLIVFIDDRAFTRECVTKSLQTVAREISVSSFCSTEHCLAERPRRSDRYLVLLNIHGRRAGEKQVEHDLSSLSQAFADAPLVVLSDVDRLECIQEAFERGARGYIPTTSTTLEIAIEVIRLVRAGGIFMPPNCFNFQQPLSEPQELGNIIEHYFTPRQVAVLHYLRQGKANKIIAHELAMSESTVKVHVRNIMKKMKATNRTEVAFRLNRLDQRAGGFNGKLTDEY